MSITWLSLIINFQLDWHVHNVQYPYHKSITKIMAILETENPLQLKSKARIWHFWRFSRSWNTECIFCLRDWDWTSRANRKIDSKDSKATGWHFHVQRFTCHPISISIFWPISKPMECHETSHSFRSSCPATSRKYLSLACASPNPGDRGCRLSVSSNSTGW